MQDGWRRRMRFAGEMICLLTLTWQSNPVLRRGSHPSLAGMLFHDKGVVKFAIQQKMNGGQRGIDYAHFISLRLCRMRFAGEMICLLTLTWQSNPVLRRSSHPSLAEMLFHEEMVTTLSIQ